MKKTILLLLAIALVPVLSLANGGDQRLVERGKYYINLSRAPFTPRVGVNTSFVASFFDVGANQLISEDLAVRVRISKLGDAPKGKFVFEQNNIVVEGGVLELPYTFNEGGLHEIFFDFAFTSNPQKIYEAPDFLIDVQRPLNGYSIHQIFMAIFYGVTIGLIAGWFVKKIVNSRMG